MKEIEYVAKLSKLEILEEDKQNMQTDLEEMLMFVDEIKSLELGEIEIDKPVIKFCDLREDEIGESLSSEQAVADCAKKKDGCFVVPLVVE